MNCRPGDIATIRTTHPMQHLHGLLVNVEVFLGEIHGETDVWGFSFLGSPQLSDQGERSECGCIQDRYLRPIRGDVADDDTTTDTTKPEEVATC